MALIRSGGTIGVLSVDYSVVYLPLGVTDPIQGTPIVTEGPLRLEGGQERAEFDVTITDELFLELMATFIAVINGTTLVGGGTKNDNQFYIRLI